MLDDVGARGRPIMQYVRDLEGRVRHLAGIQSRFKFFSFVWGVVAGLVAAGALYLLVRP